MIGFVDTSPDTAVLPAEYQRLLGYPRNRELSGRALELVECARAWYAAQGRPWAYVRQAASVALGPGDVVLIEGVRFVSPPLHRTLSEAGADSIFLAALSAGPELEQEAQRRWRGELPDEYFFLEVFGSAVVERLTTVAGARLCAEADARGLAVLPHYSPGYAGWDITEQQQLLDLICGADPAALPGPLEVLASGMLRPRKSQLAVFGLTRHRDRVRPLTELVPCENCSLQRCVYRRAPYRRPRFPSEVERLTGVLPELLPEFEPSLAAAPEAPVLTLDARYTTNLKALRRWAQDRLSLITHDDGTTDALFRYDGSTCNTMGREFRFHYTVKLGPRAERYPVLLQHCAPAPGDEGHTQMCRYRNAGPELLRTIAADQPLVGKPLDAVLSWDRAPAGPTCYCEGEGRSHKWGLVLETIHWALAERERELHDSALEAHEEYR